MATWQDIDALSARRRIDWKWIRGHGGHVDNERADQLASEGRRSGWLIVKTATSCDLSSISAIGFLP